MEVLSLTSLKKPAASMVREHSRVSWVVAAGMVSGCRRNCILLLGCSFSVLKGITMSFSCHHVLEDLGSPKCYSFKDLILAWSSKEEVLLAAVSLSKFCVKHLALGRRGTSDISLSLALLVIWLWECLCVAWIIWGEFEMLMIPYAMPKRLL